MELKKPKKKSTKRIIFLLFGFGSIASVYSQNILRYKILAIDSSALAYYYIVKVSSIEGRLEDSYNILSLKETNADTSSISKIVVGESYNFKLNPCYDVVDKRHGKDSVYLSPAFTKDVIIKGEIMISNDYKIHPYITPNLKGLYYIEDKK